MPEPTTPKPRLDRQPLWRHMLGAHLRTLRHDRSETLTETAHRAGVSTQYLSEIERGTKEPSSEVIAAVADALDVTLLDLTVAVADGLRDAQSSPARAPRGPALFALAA
jgi:transcriptional regulator with XRE-family HTH domain